ncbi:hypothetical protein OHD62_33495 [Mesorhizobium sp. YC-39]|uniref:hypothetical protein n=1 Tax=unclassified Mesorhizobium TaxID=325217 RepID=UPI0021E91674|nr:MULTISPECIES: hypothetical protein [unclassified Mesorhizobium]MCV3211523.1 hypothetical protein [Mesorhizobium sp. YC-2]MCV3233279.1 hypothetical protein [Mesorhizobium sp. YC-39]
MIVATTRNVAEIGCCAKQLIPNKLLIEQGLQVYSAATAKGHSWAHRLSRRRGNFAATNGQVARMVDLGMTSFGLLAPIDIRAKYVLPGQSLETPYIARGMA